MMVEESEEAARVQATEPSPQQQMCNSNNFDVRILTLNVWGIPGVSKDRVPRLEAICEQITSAAEPYHFVMMQEVWSINDYNIIALKLKPVLRYSHFFFSGVIGSGLCMFSSTPLNSVHFHNWSVNGLPHKVYHGDWWGGKGVALASTTLHGHNIVIATAHLHAVYHHLQDEYLHHRVVQAYESSQVLGWCASAAHTLILAGDFNCEPHEVPYRLLRYNAGLRDAFIDAPNKPVDGIGATNETPGNSYTSVSALRQDPTGKRIDHILYRPAANVKCKVQLCDLPWPLRVPGASYSYSDHEAVRAVFSITTDDDDSGDALITSNGPSPRRSILNQQQKQETTKTITAAPNNSITTTVPNNSTTEATPNDSNTETAANNSNTEATPKNRTTEASPKISTTPHLKNGSGNGSMNSSAPFVVMNDRLHNSCKQQSTMSAEHQLTNALHQQTDTLLDSAAICAQGMRSIKASKNFYTFLTFALTILNLILITVVSSSSGRSGGGAAGGVCVVGDECNSDDSGGGISGGWMFMLVLLLLLSVVITMYTLWLVVVWNRIETNAILATQLGLETLLEDLRKKNAAQFSNSSKVTVRSVQS
uniref:sphingomyelin phosphodiesterase n=1 Tax=Hirondellea gigas TaxID=1518452 RepID=A0A6A7FNX4_9CRUS